MSSDFSNKKTKVSALSAAFSFVFLSFPFSQVEAMEFPASRNGEVFFGPGAGYLPPAGTTTLGMNLMYNDWNKVTGSNGKKREMFDKVDAKSRTLVLAAIRMTNYKLLGADYGFGVALPYSYAKMDHTLETPVGIVAIQGSDTGLAGAFITPIILQWRDPTHTFNHNFRVNVNVPTGNLQKRNAGNVARDYYSVGMAYQFTYGLGSGYQLASGLSYEYNFKNRHEEHPTTAGPDGRLQNGDIAVWNLAFGRQVNNWSVGVAGYWEEQLRADQIDSVPGYDGLRAKKTGVGPVVTYRNRVNRNIPAVTVKYSKGLSSRDAITGDYLSLALGFTI